MSTRTLPWHGWVGLPESLPLRHVGYAWSFATIWPAIFEAGDPCASLRTPRAALKGCATDTDEKPAVSQGFPAAPGPPDLAIIMVSIGSRAPAQG